MDRDEHKILTKRWVEVWAGGTEGWIPLAAEYEGRETARQVYDSLVEAGQKARLRVSHLVTVTEEQNE